MVNSIACSHPGPDQAMDGGGFVSKELGAEEPRFGIILSCRKMREESWQNEGQFQEAFSRSLISHNSDELYRSVTIALVFLVTVTA